MMMVTTYSIFHLAIEEDKHQFTIIINCFIYYLLSFIITTICFVLASFFCRFCFVCCLVSAKGREHICTCVDFKCAISTAKC